MTSGNLGAVSGMPALDGEPSLRRIRAALAEHRRRLEESERTFRRWQAQWWTRERVIEQQIRRVQLQLEGLPLLVRPTADAPPPVRIRAQGQRAPVRVPARPALAVIADGPAT